MTFRKFRIYSNKRFFWKLTKCFALRYAMQVIR
jgi:hypothetical protein